MWFWTLRFSWLLCTQVDSCSAAYSVPIYGCKSISATLADSCCSGRPLRRTCQRASWSTCRRTRLGQSRQTIDTCNRWVHMLAALGEGEGEGEERARTNCLDRKTWYAKPSMSSRLYVGIYNWKKEKRKKTDVVRSEEALIPPRERSLWQAMPYWRLLT